jgi:hypothetical protein
VSSGKEGNFSPQKYHIAGNYSVAHGFPNGSAIPALIYQFIKIPLVAHNFLKRALMPLSMSCYQKNVWNEK